MSWHMSCYDMTKWHATVDLPFIFSVLTYKVFFLFFACFICGLHPRQCTSRRLRAQLVHLLLVLVTDPDGWQCAFFPYLADLSKSLWPLQGE